MVDDLERIMLIVCDVGKISAVRPDDDIYEAGFSSINSLQLLIELESALEVSIPDDQFIKARSPRAIRAVIEQSRQEQAA
jgi:acyl carrier protein